MTNRFDTPHFTIEHSPSHSLALFAHVCSTPTSPYSAKCHQESPSVTGARGGVLRWIKIEGGQVPTRAIRHLRAQGLKLDGGSVRRWWRDREKPLAADPSMHRHPGGSRRLLSAAMEEAMYDELSPSGYRRKRLRTPGLVTWPR
ncbi:unnamed protein product [Phytophthora fragariaefolia]|uniref:Unnamed protein product n=1 Tax=Phytophthora fragariaefolia TaxID=1490495 RepID=A0A9W7CZV5_9STRA|nr:unnamed protein product [Phytophthora fragariaefolia]